MALALFVIKIGCVYTSGTRRALSNIHEMATSNPTKLLPLTSQTKLTLILTLKLN